MVPLWLPCIMRMHLSRIHLQASTEAAARCNEHLLHGTQWRAEVPGLPCHDEGLSCRRGDGVVCCVSRRVRAEGGERA